RQAFPLPDVAVDDLFRHVDQLGNDVPHLVARCRWWRLCHVSSAWRSPARLLSGVRLRVNAIAGRSAMTESCCSMARRSPDPRREKRARAGQSDAGIDVEKSHPGGYQDILKRFRPGGGMPWLGWGLNWGHFRAAYSTRY